MFFLGEIDDTKYFCYSKFDTIFTTVHNILSKLSSITFITCFYICSIWTTMTNNSWQKVTKSWDNVLSQVSRCSTSKKHLTVKCFPKLTELGKYSLKFCLGGYYQWYILSFKTWLYCDYYLIYKWGVLYKGSNILKWLLILGHIFASFFSEVCNWANKN